MTGLADVGRVFVAGESSSKWHTGYGGGVWLGVFARREPPVRLRDQGHGGPFRTRALRSISLRLQPLRGRAPAEPPALQKAMLE